jgi:hypothetical protein
MKNKLFMDNKAENYTHEASDLDYEAAMMLRPLFKKYIDMGFKIRDIQYIVTGAVTDTALIELLEWHAPEADATHGLPVPCEAPAGEYKPDAP